MTGLGIGLLVALLLQFALQSVHVWGVLAACQPTLLVVVAGARRYSPVTVAWLGLAVGLVTDGLADRILGPGGIAGALAGVAVAVTARRFELEGPLFWIVGSLEAAACSEVAWTLVNASLGVRADHGALGSLATLATTGAAGLLVAAGERLVREWRSPERRRRRMLKRL